MEISPPPLRPSPVAKLGEEVYWDHGVHLSVSKCVRLSMRPDFVRTTFPKPLDHL